MSAKSPHSKAGRKLLSRARPSVGPLNRTHKIPRHEVGVVKACECCGGEIGLRDIGGCNGK